MLNQGLATGNPEDPFGIRPTSVYEQFSGNHLYLANQMAKSRKNNMGLDQLFGAAAQGVSPEELDSQNQQNAILQRSQQLAGETANLDDSQFQKFQGQLEKEVGNPTALPKQAELQPMNPIMGLLSAVGAMLDPNHAFSYGEGALKGSLNERDRQTNLNYENYNIAETARQRKVAGYGQLADNESANLNRKQSQFNNDRNVKLSILEMQQRSLDRAAQVKGTKLEKAWSAYNTANLIGEKDAAWARLQKVDPEFAPTREVLEADKAAMINQKRGAASLEADRYVKRFAADGMVNDSDKTAVEAEFRRIEKAYMLDAGSLGEVPTYKSLLKQKQIDYNTQFNLKFKYTLKAHKDMMANAAARLDLAKKSLDAYIGMGYDRMGNGYQMAEYGAKLKEWEEANGEMATIGQKAIPKLKADLAGLSRKLDATNDEAERAKIKANIEQVKGEIQFHEDSQKTEFTLPMLGHDITVPNLGKLAEGGGSMPTSPTAPLNPLAGEITPQGTKDVKKPAKAPKQTKKPQLPPGWTHGS